MVDQEGWQELSNLYLLEGEYAKSAYCMEEMILHNSQNHLYHQRNADIRYTQVIITINYCHFNYRLVKLFHHFISCIIICINFK